MLHQARAAPRAEVPAASAGITLWPATALVMGHTIGIGIFLTPAEVIGAVASPALTLALWLLCGSLVLAGALSFAELASRYPESGGLYVYLRAAWGERVAFLYGWQSLLVMDPGITAALATGMSGYVVALWPAGRGLERPIAVAAIWTLAALSMAGLTLSTRVLAVMTALKFLAFAGVVLAAFAMGGGWSHFQPFAARHSTAVPLGEALALGVVSVFFSFGGFWEAGRLGGEIRDVRRTMPRALAGGVACITAIYIATTVAFIYAQPIDGAGGMRLVADPAAPGSRVLAAVVVLSVVTSLLALLIMAPRLYVAMARHGLFPAGLATVHGTTRSPVRAILLLATLATLFALVGTFQQILAFFMCTTLVFVGLAAGGLMMVRRGRPEPAVFPAPGYPATPLLFVGLVSVIVVLLAVSRPLQAFAGFALVLLGIPVYARLAAPSGR